MVIAELYRTCAGGDRTASLRLVANRVRSSAISFSCFRSLTSCRALIFRAVRCFHCCIDMRSIDRWCACVATLPSRAEPTREPMICASVLITQTKTVRCRQRRSVQARLRRSHRYSMRWTAWMLGPRLGAGAKAEAGGAAFASRRQCQKCTVNTRLQRSVFAWMQCSVRCLVIQAVVQRQL